VRSTAARAGTGWSQRPQADRILAVAIATALTMALVLWPSFTGMAAQWRGSSTFSYGLVVPPLALYLAWLCRPALGSTQPAPTALPLLLALPVAAAWWLGQAMHVEVLHQAAAVTLVVLVVWAAVGHASTRALAYPLLYLFLMVPFGEAFVLPLMRLTASFAVTAVQATGVPVYRDGFVFSLPGGDFEVIEACSGVRFLLASLAAGAVFARVAYVQVGKRLAFIALAVVVPIVANLLRAWLVVMLVHWSGGRLATGGQHDLIGLLFYFGLLMALFLAGVRFADHPRSAVTVTAATPGPVPARRLWPVAVLLLLALAVARLVPLPVAADAPGTVAWPVLAGFDRPAPADSPVEFPAGSAATSVVYRHADDGSAVLVTTAGIGPGTPTAARPLLAGAVARPLPAEAGPLPAANFGTVSGDRNQWLLAWWFEVAGEQHRDRLRAELARLVASLQGANAPVRVVILATATGVGAEAVARRRLEVISRNLGELAAEAAP
jgi:exosortase A